MSLALRLEDVLTLPCQGFALMLRSVYSYVDRLHALFHAVTTSGSTGPYLRWARCVKPQARSEIRAMQSKAREVFNPGSLRPVLYPRWFDPNRRSACTLRESLRLSPHGHCDAITTTPRLDSRKKRVGGSVLPPPLPSPPASAKSYTYNVALQVEDRNHLWGWHDDQNRRKQDRWQARVQTFEGERTCFPPLSTTDRRHKPLHYISCFLALFPLKKRNKNNNTKLPIPKL